MQVDGTYTDRSGSGSAGMIAEESHSDREDVGDVQTDHTPTMQSDVSLLRPAATASSIADRGVDDGYDDRGDGGCDSDSDEDAATAGVVLRITSSRKFNFSAQPYTTEDLANAKHTTQLEHCPRPFTSMNLDPFIQGVGGDDSWTACVHEDYTLPATEAPYEFDFTFSFKY